VKLPFQKKDKGPIDLEQYDETLSESAFDRFLDGKIGFITSPFSAMLMVIALSMTVMQLYIGFDNVVETYCLRFTHLSLLMVVCFITKPAHGKTRGTGKPWDLLFNVLDGILILLTIAIALYVLLNYKAYANRGGMLTPLEVLLGTLYIVLLLEATRRCVGVSMVILALFFILQTRFSQYFPSFLKGPPTPLKNIVYWVWSSSEGIFGTPLGVMASYVFLFVLFGSLMNHTGAGRVFINLALALAGKKRGGPAKAAVLSSAVMGCVSGSAAGNVVTTGTFTIPLMKKVGYTPVFAASVEACASTGGQIMPPVMAATAFIIAEVMGVPYLTVVKAAVVPALLYYFSIFRACDVKAAILNLQPLSDEDIPNIKAELKEGWHLLLVLLFLIVAIVMGYSVAYSCGMAIILLLVVSSCRKGSRMSVRDLLAAVEETVRGAAPISIACAAAGVIIGCLTTSGLSVRLTSIIVNMAGDNVIILLAFTMLCAIVLGMGMPTAGVYVTLASLVIPALVQAGLPLTAAHFFPFFYGVFSNLTPPVCIAAFAAAGISGSPPMKTGFASMRLGLIAMILPWAFAFNPSLLLEGSITRILVELPLALIAVDALVYAMNGWCGRLLPIWSRALFFACCIMLITPMMPLEAAGAAGYVLLMVWYRGFGRKKTAARA